MNAEVPGSIPALDRIFLSSHLFYSSPVSLFLSTHSPWTLHFYLSLILFNGA